MARKTRKRMISGKLYNPETQEYWNRILAAEGFSTEKGRDPRLLYGGGATEIETLEGTLERGGRKLPHPQAE